MDRGRGAARKMPVVGFSRGKARSIQFLLTIQSEHFLFRSA